MEPPTSETHTRHRFQRTRLPVSRHRQGRVACVECCESRMCRVQPLTCAHHHLPSSVCAHGTCDPWVAVPCDDREDTRHAKRPKNDRARQTYERASAPACDHSLWPDVILLTRTGYTANRLERASSGRGGSGACPPATTALHSRGSSGSFGKAIAVVRPRLGVELHVCQRGLVVIRILSPLCLLVLALLGWAVDGDGGSGGGSGVGGCKGGTV